MLSHYHLTTRVTKKKNWRYRSITNMRNLHSWTSSRIETCEASRPARPYEWKQTNHVGSSDPCRTCVQISERSREKKKVVLQTETEIRPQQQ